MWPGISIFSRASILVHILFWERVCLETRLFHLSLEQGRAIGAIAAPETYESNFFTLILYNSENNIRDI